LVNLATKNYLPIDKPWKFSKIFRQMSWKVFQFKKNIGFLFWYLTIFVGFFFLLTKNDDKRVVMSLDHISTYYILFQLGVGEGNQGSIHRIALCVPR
jgi:hypothetical protein